MVVVDVLAGLGFAVLLIWLHEYGHLWTGRVLGVPRHAIKVRLDVSPPHVALHDGRGWLSPADAGYAEKFTRHCPGLARAYGFVAGGAGVESAVSFLTITLLVGVGRQPVALVLAAATLILFFAYVVLDIALSAWRRVPYGDFAVLWTLSPASTLAWVLALAILKTGTLLWLM